MNAKKINISNQIKINTIQPKEMKNHHWVEDFESFYEMIKNNYPYLWVKERTHGYNWIDLKEKFIKKIRNAKETNDYLDVFWDAIIALQNRHTSLWLPKWIVESFKEESWHQKVEPYKSIFTKQVKEAYDYWKPIIECHYEQRFQRNYEVVIAYHHGEYLIADGLDGWQEKFGYHSKILAVNDIPIDEAIKNAYETGFLDWDTKRKKCFRWIIKPQQFGDDAEFTLQTGSGTKKKVVFKTTKESLGEDLSGYPKEGIRIRIWPERKIGYLWLESFMDQYMDERQELLVSFYKNIENYNHLILDVRGNMGGSFRVWIKNIIAPLIKEKLVGHFYLAYRKGDFVSMYLQHSKGLDKIVQKNSFDYLPPEVKTDDFTVYDFNYAVEPTNEVDFKGKIIILIDGNTFSATDAFALYCKETKFGEIYGTQSGGDGISYSPIYYVLPNSKILVRYTPAMGIDYTGHSNEVVRVQPDIHYESEISNFEELIDHILQTVIPEKKD